MHTNKINTFYAYRKKREHKHNDNAHKQIEHTKKEDAKKHKRDPYK